MKARFTPGFVAIARGLNLRHLVRRRLRTGLTVSGIAAGVALVFSISLINATLLSTFRASVRDIAGRAEIEVAATDQRGMSVDVVSQIARLEGVELVAPAVRATTMLTGPGADRQRTLVLGITPAFRALFPDDNPFAQLNVEGGFGTKIGRAHV